MKNKKIESDPAVNEEAENLTSLTDDSVEQVTGAGNPWGGFKGVPQNPIDDDLRGRA